jgi:hypothetical protein
LLLARRVLKFRGKPYSVVLDNPQLGYRRPFREAARIRSDELAGFAVLGF